MARNILVVEDDNNISNLIKMYLDKEGFEVRIAADGGKAVEEFKEKEPDLVLLDVMLPVLDGWGVCAKIRETSKCPIIMLTAKGEVNDRIHGLEMGADDYVPKAFSPRELLARVRAALRLNRFSSNPTGVFQAQDLLIQYERRKVYVGGEEIKLTQTEYNIVAFLSEHAGRVMTYPAIVRAIWGDTDCGSTKKLQVNMANIRRKLGSRPGHNNYIMNELGVGYRMIDADHDGPDAPADHEENA